MGTEPTAGANAGTDRDAANEQESDDQDPDDTVRHTTRMPRALRDVLERVVDRGHFTSKSEAVRHALRSTFGTEGESA